MPIWICRFYTFLFTVLRDCVLKASFSCPLDKGGANAVVLQFLGFFTVFRMAYISTLSRFISTPTSSPSQASIPVPENRSMHFGLLKWDKQTKWGMVNWVVDDGFGLVSKNVWDYENLRNMTGDTTTPRAVNAGLRDHDDTTSGRQRTHRYRYGNGSERHFQKHSPSVIFMMFQTNLTVMFWTVREWYIWNGSLEKAHRHIFQF